MNISEKAQWENNVSMLTRLDKVEGGREGAANIQAKQLGNRTQYLKQAVEAYSTLIKSGELPYSNQDEAKAAIAAGKIPACGGKNSKTLMVSQLLPGSACLIARAYPSSFSRQRKIRQVRTRACQ